MINHIIILKYIIPMVGIILSIIGFSFLIHSGILDYSTHDNTEDLTSKQEYNKLSHAKVYNITGVCLLFLGFLFMQGGLYLEIRG